MKKLGQFWETYKNQVIPDAGENQINGSREAFYGGAATMMKLVKQAAEADDVQACLNMQALADELTEWEQLIYAEAAKAEARRG